ncbi:MAG: DUF7948 domain-containing protein [Armatimonadota bacterium]
MRRDRWIWRSLVLMTAGLAALSVPGDISSLPDGHEAAGVRPDGGIPRLLLEEYGRIPLHFEANLGQTDSRVKFLARGRGHTVFLTPTEAVLALGPRGSASSLPRHELPGSAEVRIKLVDASPNPHVSGRAPLPGRVNYFIGNDPARWRANIPTYARVRYEAVYPGVDLVFYGNQHELEYDFVLAPGADPAVIALGINGANRIAVDSRGDLVLHVSGTKIIQRRPAAYQVVNGIRRAISADYAIQGKERVGFHVGAYDVSRPLIIDPILSYSTYLGGSVTDIGYDIAVDGAGNAYITGRADSADFPTTAGAYDTTRDAINDVFVTKLNPTGTGLVYSTFLGGNSTDIGFGIVVDSSGNAYLTGVTQSSNFPTTPGAFDTTDTDLASDAFVTKLNPTGSALVYSTYLGGSGNENDGAVPDIDIDASGNAYVTGYTDSSNFPTTPGAFDTFANGGPDVYVTKLNPAGSALVYSTYLGGSGTDIGQGIAVDPSGNAFVTGNTQSILFPTTVGAFDTTWNGSRDVFVTKVNPSGSALVYSTFVGGTSNDGGTAIAVDVSGNAYIAGGTSSANYPTAGVPAFDTLLSGPTDAVVTKVNAAGSGLVYSTYLGGGGNDLNAWGIAVDASGSAHVVGQTASLDFPIIGAIDPTANGGEDAFVVKFNPAGSGLTFSTYLGGTGDDVANGIAMSASRNAYLTGSTLSANFPTTLGAFDSTLAGQDAFVTRISTPGMETVGLHNPATSTFFLKNTNAAGPADVVFGYGPGGLGWVPLAGDWDGNGTDTAGIYDPMTSTFFLKNTNAAGPADIVFSYGPGGMGWMPVVGDWDGDGDDTVGLYDGTSSTFFLRNTHAAGPADVVFGYGPAGAGWTPLTGDWDGNSTDTVGLYNGGAATFFLRNTNAAGLADIVFAYGPAGMGWIPVVGDWDATGTTTAGLYNGTTSTFFLKNTNAAGPADIVFGYGPAGAGWTPLAGDWNGL